MSKFGWRRRIARITGTQRPAYAALAAAALCGMTLLPGARTKGADRAVVSTEGLATDHQVAAEAKVETADAAASQEGPKKSSDAAVKAPSKPAVKSGMFHLGIQITTLPEVVRSQLQLKQGVLIERVLPDSPAAKAGVKPHDILLAASETPIHQPEDILNVLRQADGKPLSLRILRQGQQQTIEVAPEPAPEARPQTWWGPFPPTTPFRTGVFGPPMPPDFKQWPEYKQLEEALERFRSKIGRDGVGLWFARPGLVLPPGKVEFFWGSADQAPSQLRHRVQAQFPDGLTVEIVREEAPTARAAARIHVQRGDQSWDLTEDRLSELPKDVLPRVQRLLSVGMGWWVPVAVRALKIEKTDQAGNEQKEGKAGGPGKDSPSGDADGRSGASVGEIQKVLERLERANQAAQEKMEEAIRQLRKELEELRRGQAAPSKP